MGKIQLASTIRCTDIKLATTLVLCGAVLGTTITAQQATAAEMTGKAAMNAAWKADAAPERPDPQMKAVLNQLAALKPKPIEKLTPQQARWQPGPPDAVKALLRKQGRSTAPEAVGSVQDHTISTSAGPVKVRVYKPAGNGPFPIIVYLHGGGWVIASVAAYDSSARALTNAARSIVVAPAYSLAPEHKFPTAHEQSYATTQWVIKNGGGWGGNTKKVAIVGESAGGNMATAVCLMARDRKAPMPIHQVLIYPVTDTVPNTPSYRENAKAKPLNAPMLAWFLRYTVSRPADKNNKYLAVTRNNLRGLPPATIILAEIDPLRSEGVAYAQKLQAAGVPVRFAYYTGVTHEFFGMGAVVDQARQAVNFAANGLKAAYAK
jgi:acetyl esterase